MSSRKWRLGLNVLNSEQTTLDVPRYLMSLQMSFKMFPLDGLVHDGGNSSALSRLFVKLLTEIGNLI